MPKIHKNHNRSPPSSYPFCVIMSNLRSTFLGILTFYVYGFVICHSLPSSLFSLRPARISRVAVNLSNCILLQSHFIGFTFLKTIPNVSPLERIFCGDFSVRFQHCAHFILFTCKHRTVCLLCNSLRFCYW